MLIEVEGGIWVNGRHNRAAGLNADLEPSRLAGGEMDSAQRNPQGPKSVRRDAGQKYLEAGHRGWRVFRLGPDQITIENVARLERQVRGGFDRFSTESTHPLDAQFLDPESTSAKRAVKKVES